MSTNGHYRSVDNINVLKHLWILLANRIFTKLYLFANFVGDVEVIDFFVVLIQCPADISDCTLHRNRVERDDFSRPNTRKVHLIPQQELLDSVSVFTGVVCINVCIGNAGRVHKPEKVQAKPHTVHLCDTKQIRYHATGHRTTAVAALDSILFLPLSEVGLQ